MAHKLGKYTYLTDAAPSVLAWGSVGSKKEAQGPLAPYFDLLNEDSTFGEQTWEKAESEMQKEAIAKALEKAGLSAPDLDCIFAGDLLNQCTGSTFGLRELGVPFLGLYGACSTMAEGLVLSAFLLDSGAMQKTAVITSSHFCSAERQYRFPLEYGGQRTPTSQWTATASGAAILGQNVSPPYIRAVCVGTIEDKGIKDQNNMGAAMAPAAYETIKAHLEDLGRKPSDYDLILTGDLGSLGKEILLDLFHRDGVELPNLEDCGVLIYDAERQDVHCGGSGCGCSAVVLCGLILNGMNQGRWKKLLFCGTGALLSPTSTQQGESIPCICHAAALEGPKD